MTTNTDCRRAERFEELVGIWRALSPTRQSRWTGRVLALGTRPGLMDRIAIAAALPSVPVLLGSLGLDFFREFHQQARRTHRDRARRLADDALSYRAAPARVKPRPNTFRGSSRPTRAHERLRPSRSDSDRRTTNGLRCGPADVRRARPFRAPVAKLELDAIALAQHVDALAVNGAGMKEHLFTGGIRIKPNPLSARSVLMVPVIR